MRSDVKVSVVIPCYNAARFLPETLASIFNQTYPVYEVIVVDDGSTDDSAAIADSFGPLVRVIRQPNQGESVARNRGISATTGDWVALLDADDIWEPQKIERQVEAAVCLSSSYVCVYSDTYRFDGAKRFPVEPREEYHALPDARVRLLFDWCVTASAPIIRRTVLRFVRFPEEVRHGEDPIFTAQLRDHGRFLRIPEGLTGLRFSSTQQTRDSRHFLLKTASLFRWFSHRTSCYSQPERDYVFGRIRNDIAEGHDVAYWRRQLDLVRGYRRLAVELYGAGDALTPLFPRPLFPPLAYSARDWVSHALKKVHKRTGSVPASRT